VHLPLDGQRLCIKDYYRAGEFKYAEKLRGIVLMQEKGVFDVDWKAGLTLVEIAKGIALEEIVRKTEAPFKIADGLK
jgi:acyl CoA:acetate/3-ketoacid CoA transferase beta subunit